MAKTETSASTKSVDEGREGKPFTTISGRPGKATAVETSTIGLMIYNTHWEGYNLSLEQVARLAELPRCVSLKWCTPDGGYSYVRGVHRFADRFAVVDNQGLAVMNHMLGGTGFITHLATIWPEHPGVAQAPIGSLAATGTALVSPAATIARAASGSTSPSASSVPPTATTPHADLERWKISLANLGGIPHTRMVPGHGPAEESTRGLDQTRKWLDTVESQIKDAFEKGLDVTEAIALLLPAWTEKIALSRYEYERTVMHLYPKLEAARWPRVDK